MAPDLEERSTWTGNQHYGRAASSAAADELPRFPLTPGCLDAGWSVHSLIQGNEKDQFALFGEVPISQAVPEDHPLRVIRRIFDEIWSEMEHGFEGRYSQVGQPSIPTVVLSIAWL